MGPFTDGDTALLLDPEGNRYLVTLRSGGRFVFHRGTLAHDALIGSEQGVVVRTSTRFPLVALRPRLLDYALEMPRTTAIVYPKDVGMLLIWADIFPGATVLEAGLGSGSLTLALLRAVGVRGQVISYELRSDFITQALQNIRRFGGEPSNLLIREHDIYTGIPDRELDRLILDLAEPWRVVPLSIEALRPGGVLAAYTPSILQAQHTVEAIERAGHFAQVETLETFYRPWHIRDQAVRPVQQMIGHTAFLTFARRVQERPGSQRHGAPAPGSP